MNNKKNIILEEYENEFSYKKSKTNLDIQFNRIAFIFFVFLVISVIYSIQLLHLGSLKSDVKTNYTPSIKDYRADIIDRNGNYLVKSVKSIDIGISPIEVINKQKLLINLKWIFPDKDFAEVEKKLNKNKFFNFEKKISSTNYQKIMSLGDKAIRPEEKLTRIYPQKNLFSHIIGQIDNENNGISGLEKSFDEELKQRKKPLQLTVDTDIQYLIRTELSKYQKIFDAKGGAAILMNVNNGEIISMVSLPDFDLNKRETIVDVNYINRVTKGIYELGSVFKTFTIASGINYGLIEPDTKFLDSKKSINCGDSYTINEYDNKMPSDLSVENILIKSGNIGSVRIAKKIGIEKHKSFLKTIGIIDKINFDIDEVGKPLKIDWYEGCKIETIAFGHGITTTILQLAKGYAIISNGGYEITPTLIRDNSNEKIKKVKVLNNDVSKKMNSMMRKVVSEGTAKLVNVEGYQVGGKTGTAEQVLNNIYSKTKINTLASIFPTDSPKFVLVVMLESTKNNKDYTYEYRDGSGFKLLGSPRNTAGWTTVEAAGKIIDKIGPILATKYIEN
ncbi:penicillin-binding protein 2 [Candidatus Pelagibacter bacterium]|jgi:cell division protein FtsI (penicillin-binding protein 3)|nr:penicillin-binding protein 2 [Candidatus Pelagibacter bacterium]MDA8835158.1 penicillin-binding protein 2 [Candidatus Pelagibacter bacterium]MDB9728520.1 penicillin-binding protein 2 [Candidatus Pelagibacter ubique]MDC1178770.1 penicillin-binding protein 2 [Candidatus Pelagibacter ubique]